MHSSLRSLLFRSTVALSCTSSFTPGTVQSQTIDTAWSDVTVLGGFTQPVGCAWDGNGRMYVWEKAGRVKIVVAGVVTGTLIDISDEVGNWGDHGLLGFALDPAFLTNGYIYLMYVVDRHHLLYAGTGSYNAATNDYYTATIIRITRYTANGPAFNTVNPASRLVLLGESATTGVPILHDSHGAGTLMFGTDGTLLATVGDGASYGSTDVGSASETYHAQALIDGIIRPAENVGAFRSQMVNSLNGKILRLDPATGDGLPSNPFFLAGQARVPQSRVWALGLRNGYRASVRPGSGSTVPADGDPGTIYFGDVQWNQWEDVNICYEGGMNFGWPLFEGLTAQASYTSATVYNMDAPNPLYDGASCPQFLQFKDLLKQDSPIHLNGHPNPCNSSVQIPNNLHKFFHARPVIDYEHGSISRAGAFSGNTAVQYWLTDPLSPIQGPLFNGYASIGGFWTAGTNLPAGYQNVYFHADYVAGWIRRFTFSAPDQPAQVHDFASGLGSITWLGGGPDGCVWWIKYNTSEIHRICPLGTVNLPPSAVAQQSVQYGPGPLTVNFSSTGSSDPEGQPLTHAWNFGDGGTSVLAAPSHVFTAPPGVPTLYTVTLTVTDNVGQTGSKTLIVSVNNTPPQVDITSFASGALYPVGVDTTFTLSATVSDAEHAPAQLTHAWQTILHHNTHEHPEPVNNAPTTSTVIPGVGCDGQDYSYEIRLTVTDAAGLSTTDVNWLYPNCAAIAPVAVIEASTAAGEGPLNVTFDGSGSFDPGSIVSYHWDFGDGTSATGATTAHLFTDTGDHQVTLTVTDNDGLTGQAVYVISVITFDPPQCVGAAGSILRQYWNGVGGTSVSDLLNSPNYPDNPSGTTFPTSFLGPTTFGNSYGTRMRGYIVAPEDGNYTFVVTSDDNSAFYISLNADPKYKYLACSVPGYTNATQYDKFPQQTSASIHLKAGKYYYVELLHKEGSGGDHCRVSWTRPSNATITTIAGTYLVRWQDCPPSVTVRTNLQGPYNASTGLMDDDLRALGLVPATEPFTALGFTHAGGGGGETVPPAMLATGGPNAIVDWVLVEVRDKNTPATLVRTRSALLQRDGDVVGTDGYPRLLFSGLAADNYFVAIRHRNHLGAMTATGVALNKNERNVDLTTGTTATYGTAARRQMANGRFALWAGNTLRDNTVKYTNVNNDRDPILTAIGGVLPTNTVAGYHMTDVNLDGTVKYTGSENDRDFILLNIGGQVPTSTRQEQLP